MSNTFTKNKKKQKKEMNSWNYVLRQIESRRLRQALLPSVRTRLGTDGVLRNNKRCPSTSSLVFFNTQFRP